MAQQELEEFVRIIKRNRKNDSITINNILRQRALDISGTDVVKIPKSLVKLERLECQDCPLLTKIPETLVNLYFLNCSGCPLLTNIPITLVNLTQLNCRNCPLLTEIPGTLVHLEKLSCSGCPLMVIPPSIREGLIDCKGEACDRASVDQELEEFVRIIKRNRKNDSITINNILRQRALDISGTDVVKIPKSIVKLEELDCHDCPLLTDIPETLVNLRYFLNCSGCPMLTNIPETLLDLYTLNCQDCPLLRNIPGTLVKIYSLECYGCLLLTEIPRTFVKLEKLECGNCPLLTKIPETLVRLKTLDCQACPVLVEIPETLVNLTTLWCIDCPLLVEIPNTLVKLTGLECTECNLTTIPETLVNLVVLCCQNCPLLAEVPETFVNLTALDCAKCPLITKIPETLVKLKGLDCGKCPLITSIPETLVNLKILICKGCPLLIIPPIIRQGLTECEGEACDDPFSHPQIGKNTQYNNGMAIGDPTAPYQIPMSKQFVQKTQYRKLPLNDEVLRIHLQTEPKPHVVFACPVGHLHSRADCGVPTELRVCNEGDNCPFIVGGIHHFLAPGNYIVYHDGYVHANVWYGNFPVFDYPTYELLVEQYNLAADKVNLPRIVPVAELGFTNVARLSDIPVAEGTECPMCGDELEVGKTYVLPDCGHPICEECLSRIRGGNIANINVGDAENFQRRRCGVCSQRFRFGGVPKKYKLYKDNSSCIIC
jgi:Leucine-rich repeat (LRR) protein